jgi:ADP-ribosyl-[dinitrogen reductase] hydrolase
MKNINNRSLVQVLPFREGNDTFFLVFCDNLGMDIKRDRLTGIALGAVVGDALGMPLEFFPPRHIHDFETEMVDGPLPAGTFTDDTEMALALAESLLAHSPLEGADLAQRFVDWYRAGPPDIGIHTSHVLGLIAAGTPWQEAAAIVQSGHPESASNGSLMRCWPVTVACWNNPDLLINTARLQSVITHPHPDCVNACLFFNTLLRLLVNRLENLPPDAVLREAIKQAADLVELGEELRLLVELAPVRAREALPNSGWVRHTLESALWAVLTTRSFEEAVVQAVNLGNDADTTGSVTGALAGALYGAAAIPRRWVKILRGEYPIRTGRLWHAEDLVNLVKQLSGLA